MGENYTLDMKKNVILNFLQNNGNKGCSQGDIARGVKTDLLYKTEESARVSIGKIMLELEKDGKAYFVERKPKRGNLQMRVWYLGNKNGIQSVSGEE